MRLYHSLLAEIKDLEAKLEVMSKKLKVERSKKSRYKTRWLKLRPKVKKYTFKVQVALNLIHRRATTNPELTMLCIADQSGLAYSYIRFLTRQYTKENN